MTTNTRSQASATRATSHLVHGERRRGEAWLAMRGEARSKRTDTRRGERSQPRFSAGEAVEVEVEF